MLRRSMNALTFSEIYSVCRMNEKWFNMQQIKKLFYLRKNTAQCLFLFES